ncbi:IclR family transcriptional regulator [Rhodovarius crocodyli]|uniref:IclR family transcriptional regulator n=2 Tax=Rhodovarius crocodyli TaxID=1979269 RepID=A0A437MNL6_9PROT|nr:IclR family transcriptional regulator [Rhodovarius crocodyli]
MERCSSLDNLPMGENGTVPPDDAFPARTSSGQNDRMSDISQNQSLQRGLAILAELSEAAPLGVRDLARRSGLAPAIAQRLINTMAHEGWLEQEEASRRYRLGPKLMAIAARLDVRDRMTEAAAKAFAPMAARGFNSYLGALRGERALYMVTLQSNGPIGIRSAPGDLGWLHSTAMGKCLLAGMSDEAALALLGPGPLHPVTADTLTDPAEVVAQLPGIRAQGYAMIQGENLPGVTSIGAPVKDAAGTTVAAISVAWIPAAAPGQSVQEATDAVLAAARAISGAIGGEG